MNVLPLCLIVFLQIYGFNTLIVPDEVPTILSVIFSNIPTIKKGTDSRLGWGFRLGDRADFQVLVELGPQTYTQPLGNQPDKDGTNKRSSLDTLANRLYAQRQQEKKIIKQQQLEKENDTKPKATDGSTWLKEWSKNVGTSKENVALPVTVNAKPGIALGEIDAKSVIPEDDVNEPDVLPDSAELFKSRKPTKILQKPVEIQKPLDDVSVE